MAKDVRIYDHLQDEIGKSLDRQFLIELLSKYPQIDKADIDEAASMARTLDELLKKIQEKVRKHGR